MNTTPRFLNRLVLGVVGIFVLATGAAGLMLLALPGAAAWWGGAAPRIGEEIEGVRRSTTVEGQADTWLWVVLAAVLVLLIVLLVSWILAQGRGRAALFWSADTGRSAASGGYSRSSAGSAAAPAASPSGSAVPSAAQGAGTVSISAATAEQLLKTALLERPDLVGASVSTWCVRGVPGLRVRVHPRKGTPPYAVAEEVSRLVEALDVVTGLRVPVLISVTSGGRARFSRAERVS